jgi:peptide/nickel transport system permease protein
MTIVFASLMVVNIVGVLGALMVQKAPQKIGKLFRKVTDFFESVPDLLVIFLFIYFGFSRRIGYFSSSDTE